MKMIKSNINIWFVWFMLLLLVIIYQTSLIMNMSHILNSWDARFTQIENNISDIKRTVEPLKELSNALKWQELDDLEIIIE